jgi:hypothetical protein
MKFLNFKKIFDTQDDGFESLDFHSKCDLKNNILVVIESNDGFRYGGFTSLAYDQKKLSYVEGGFNFIFSLNKMKIFS